MLRISSNHQELTTHPVQFCIFNMHTFKETADLNNSPVQKVSVCRVFFSEYKGLISVVDKKCTCQKCHTTFYMLQ